MYMQISFNSSSGTTVDSVEITLGEKTLPLLTCVFDNYYVDLIRKYVQNSQPQQNIEDANGSTSALNSSEGSNSTKFELLVSREGDGLEEIIRILEEGIRTQAPEISEEGVNGTYFLKDTKGNTLAVFKPHDEEGNSQNNPKLTEDNQIEDLSKGLLPGEGVLREVAAYLLDHGHFSGVPRTSLVKLNQFREDQKFAIGSLQEFVSNVGASWDMGPNAFPVHEVHKIGILDLRILNADRHGGNILLNRNADGTYNLIPIDHGFSLTENLDKAWFDWTSWPQAKRSFDAESLAYIAALDIEQDAKILEGLGIRNECIRTMKISTYLLKKAASVGLNLYQIGNIASRSVFDEPSELENLFEQALEETSLTQSELKDPKNETKFLETIHQLMDAAVESKLN